MTNPGIQFRPVLHGFLFISAHSEDFCLAPALWVFEGLPAGHVFRGTCLTDPSGSGPVMTENPVRETMDGFQGHVPEGGRAARAFSSPSAGVCGSFFIGVRMSLSCPGRGRETCGHGTKGPKRWGRRNGEVGKSHRKRVCATAVSEKLRPILFRRPGCSSSGSFIPFSGRCTEDDWHSPAALFFLRNAGPRQRTPQNPHRESRNHRGFQWVPEDHPSLPS